jgi:hypothetical protein
MAGSVNMNRVSFTGALSLAVSGILFVLYPAVRPFSSEKALEGAAAFASDSWILAHVLAMLAFILLVAGLFALYVRSRGKAVERLAIRSLFVLWFGVGLTLPFYGAEAFGLHAIGQEALRVNNPALMSIAREVRTGPGLPLFLAGLVLVAGGAILTASVMWQSPGGTRWSGFPLAVGFVLYIPQFAAPQPIRVAHGALIAWGCIWTAVSLWRWSAARDRSPRVSRSHGSR